MRFLTFKLEGYIRKAEVIWQDYLKKKIGSIKILYRSCLLLLLFSYKHQCFCKQAIQVTHYTGYLPHVPLVLFRNLSAPGLFKI